MSAGGDTEWINRAPKQSPAMKAAYAGLAQAEAYLREVHADKDWDAHHEAVAIMVDWHREIGRICQEEGKARSGR